MLVAYKQQAAPETFHSVDRSCRSRQQAEISDLAMQEKHKLNRHCCNGRFLCSL